MSKFNNPSRALAPPSPLPTIPPPQVLNRPKQPRIPPPVPAPAAEPRESLMVAVGFVTFCVLLIGGMVNDWLYLLFGGKGYIISDGRF